MRIKLILAASKNDALAGLEPFMPLSLPLLAAAAPKHDYRFIDMMRPTAVRKAKMAPTIGQGLGLTRW